MIVGLLLWGVAHADCPTGPASNVSLQRQVESALFSFVELDDDGFERHRADAVASVFCLQELVHPHLAAEFLRLEGLYAFTRRDERFASVAFRNALQIEPTHRLPSTLAPPGGPLHQLYTRAGRLPPETYTLPEGSFRAYVNGQPASAAPQGLAVVQLVVADGTLPFSGVITSADDLPKPLLESLAGPPLGPLDPQRDGEAPRTARTPLALTALVAGLAAGGLFSGAAVSRLRYDAAPTSKRRQATNTLTLGSAGAGAASIGLALTAIALPARKR